MPGKLGLACSFWEDWRKGLFILFFENCPWNIQTDFVNTCKLRDHQLLHFRSTPCWILSTSQGFQRNCGWKYWLIWLVNVLHLPYQSARNKKYQFTQGSVFKFVQFAPGACSQIFKRLNIVEHFAWWKFCSRGCSIPMKSLIYTEELCSRSVPLEPWSMPWVGG